MKSTSLLALAVLVCPAMAREPPALPPGNEALFVTNWGSPRCTPILLVHGLMGSGRYWTPVARGLAADHFVVAPDLLGFGRSPKPASGYDATAQARAVLSALDEQGVKTPVWIAAHSLGALVALRLAVLAPGRVRGIVTFGPPLFRDLAEARARIGAQDPVARLALRDSLLARGLCELFHRHPRLASASMRVLRPGLPPVVREDAPLHSWASLDRSVTEAILSTAPAEWLIGAGVPVRLVLGGSDPIADPAWLAELARRRPGIELVVVAGADHHLPVRDPGRAIAEIRALLR